MFDMEGNRCVNQPIESKAEGRKHARETVTPRLAQSPSLALLCMTITQTHMQKPCEFLYPIDRKLNDVAKTEQNGRLLPGRPLDNYLVFTTVPVTYNIL